MRLEVGKCYRSTAHDVNGEPRLCFEVLGIVTSHVLFKGPRTVQAVLWRHQVLSWHEQLGPLEEDNVVEISVDDFKKLWLVINLDRDEAEQRLREEDEDDD